VHGSAQPGWYPDPWAESWYRWWDGREWTPSLQPAQVVVAEPRPPHTTRTFPAVAGPAILAATFAAIVFTRFVVDNIGISADWVVILIAYVILFGLMTLGAWLLSKALGTGSLRKDFGFRMKVDDIGWGALAFAGSFVSRLLLVPFLSDDTDPVRDPGRTIDPHGAALAAFAIAALIGAPLIEELVFRGVLQRSLNKVVGPYIAIGAQALLFAAYHFVPNGSGYSHLYFGLLTSFGVAAGIVAERTGRLGPGMVAHFINNSLAVLVMTVT
jgi:uncharacterized protein